MPLLTRQRTLESVLSWWSDSNRPGATIDLHAAAKPLMKWMYHRQALDFIKKNHDLPLSEETLQIYSNYLGWKYVPHSTKIAILTELTLRASSEEDARALVHSGLLYVLPQLSEERSWGIAKLLLEHLGRHGSTTVATCATLVDLIRASSTVLLVVELEALCNIAGSPDGAEAAMDAIQKVLDHVAKLLRLPTLQPSVLTMVTTLAGHKSTGKTTCKHLVSLLCEGNIGSPAEIIDALSDVALSHDGGLACIDAKLVDHVGELLQLPNCKLPTLRMVRRLGRAYTLSMNVATCEQLVALLYDTDSDVQDDALEILCGITHSPQGAQAAIDAKILDRVVGLLESPNCRLPTLNMVRRLPDNYKLFMDITACKYLVALLDDSDVDVQEGAVAILCNITHLTHGARAAMDAKVLDHISAPFASGDTDVQTWTSMMLEHLASNPDMAAATCERLVVFLSDENDNVRYGAVAALSEISKSIVGARAAADARVLDHIGELLESPSLQVGRLAFGIVVELARYG
ncbi:armadillo-type protein [Mycena vulgaris]|nr:armadillo-type protein [Mycena vulgaris]